MRKAAFVLGAMVLAQTLLASAQGDKVLENLRGVVFYQLPDGKAHPLAPEGSTVLNDRDVAMTGPASLGALTLPDSSRITLGQDTRVLLGLFDQRDGTSAKFIVYNGKTRFSIQHPQGAKADYMFETPTAQIAVRGTIGDISVDAGDGMRLNVYHLGDAKLPVNVQTIYGEHFTLRGGQKLWVRWQGGRLIGRQTRLSKAEIDRFSEFGPPAIIDGGTP